MVIGHIAAALAAKAVRRDVPLWQLLVAANLVDIIWIVSIIFGVEHFHFDTHIPPAASQLWALQFAPSWISHHLLLNIVIALGVGLWLARRRSDIGVGVLVAAVILSHWWLDLVVHRPDLTIAPGLPLQGWGLWEFRNPALLLEIFLFCAASMAYVRRTQALPNFRHQQRLMHWFFVVLVISQVFMSSVAMLGPHDEPQFLIQFVIFIVGTAFWAHLFDSRRGAKFTSVVMEIPSSAPHSDEPAANSANFVRAIHSGSPH